MDTRRSFLKKAGLLSGGWAVLPPTLQKAFAINPAPGSTFYDAEHVIFLMQENRSFDHALGTLQGVRGFNDPRAVRLPNGDKVWMQTNAKGEAYMPFPYSMMDSNITWIGGLPHGWTDQVDARNRGRYDQWLQAKDPGGEHEGKPYTMGYFSRKDIPFYYALADCFTVCDHNFCSSLTGTTPNRLYFWSGTIREKMQASAQANVWNHNADHGAGIVNWKTYPERLEEQGVSWKVYQNELYLDVGLGEKQSWLDNFGDNPLEYMEQYHARMHPEYIRYLPTKISLLKQDIESAEKKLTGEALTTKEKDRLQAEIGRKRARLAGLQQEQVDFTMEKWEGLSAFQKNIHRKAFDTNRADANYHALTDLRYKDGDTERTIAIPKGDVLKNFREDVQQGKLPTVSWLAAPEHFSDHPSSAWFGAWYVSEVMDILTQNPEVWKKCILVLTYDENDGYFDHLPPYGAPNPYAPNSGKVSAGIDATAEWVRREEQSEKDPRWMRESNIGLGYRVPMIIASPWSRGGFVCSEVFDHTSSLQFLETFLEKKTGKKIREENITRWRRTVCGNLSSAFRPYHGEAVTKPEFLERDKFVQDIYNAKFKGDPQGFRKLTETDKRKINGEGHLSDFLPRQEKGVRNACALPYQLAVHGALDASRQKVMVALSVKNEGSGNHAGAPFYVYMAGLKDMQGQVHRDYAVAKGDTLQDGFDLALFREGVYHLEAYGPNGFYRAFTGSSQDPAVTVRADYAMGKQGRPDGNLLMILKNTGARGLTILLKDESYGTGEKKYLLKAGAEERILFRLDASHHWYDLSVRVDAFPDYVQRFAGHIETGATSKTDPLMGGVVGNEHFSVALNRRSDL